MAAKRRGKLPKECEITVEISLSFSAQTRRAGYKSPSDWGVLIVLEINDSSTVLRN
jgi:hypothetical protein